MRRPAPEVLATLVLVAVLGAAGVGVAAISLTGSDETAAPPEPATSAAPSSPDVTPLEPSAPAATRPGSGSSSKPPRATASSCPDLTREVPLRVLTLNTHGAQSPRGFDIDRVAALIRSARVDVALLQEVDRFRGRSRGVDMPAALAARTGMDVAYGLNVDLPGRAVSGTATLSRLPILSQRNIRLPTAPGRKPRGLLQTDVDVHGVRVSLFNTHLEDQVLALKLRQAAALRGPVLATSHPVVLGGDLNSVPTSPMMASVRTVLTDTWLQAGAGPGWTWPVTQPRLRIDYLYHSAAVRVSSVEVLGARVSDHRALRAGYVLETADDQVCVPELDGPVGGGGERG